MTDIVYTRNRSKTSEPVYDKCYIKGGATYPTTKIFLTWTLVSQSYYGFMKWTSDIRFRATVTGNDSPVASAWDSLTGKTYEETLIGVSYDTNWKGASTVKVAAYLSKFVDNTGDMPTETETPYISDYSVATIRDCKHKNFHKRWSNGEVFNDPVSNIQARMKCDYENYQVTPSQIGKVSTSSGNYTEYLIGSSAGDTLGSNVIPLYPLTDDEYLHKLNDMISLPLYNSLTDMRQNAINTAFGQVNTGAYSYLEELAEGKETFLFLVSSFKRVASMMKCVKSGRWKTVVPKTWKRVLRKAKRLKRESKTPTTLSEQIAKIQGQFVMSAWMELRFAVRPLVYGVEDAIKIYNEGLKAKHGRIVENYGDSGEYNYTNTVEDINTSTGITTTTTTTISNKRSVSAGVLLKVDTSTATLRNLGFTNLAGTLWEVTFLSWALDYFVNLNGLLYKVTPNIGVDTLAAWASVHDIAVVHQTIVRTDTATNTYQDRTEFSVELDKYLRAPVSGPSFINLNVDLDAYKLIDLIGVYTGLARNQKLRS